MKEIIDYLLANGAKISDAGEGKVWTNPKSEWVTRVRSRFIVTYNRIKYAGKYTVEDAVRCIVRHGALDMTQFGYTACSKCNGSGQVSFTVSNGICFRCSGFGYKKCKTTKKTSK